MSVRNIIAKAIAAERRRLNRMMVLPPLKTGDALDATIEPQPRFKPREIDALIRIEINYPTIDLMAEAAYRAGEHDNWLHPNEGPPKFMGVPIYTVERLPAPGWRVLSI